MKRTIRKVNENKKYALIYKEKIRDSVNSYTGRLIHINAFKLRREICLEIQSSIGKVFDAAPDFSKIIIRKEYTMESCYKRYYKQQKHKLKPILL